MPSSKKEPRSFQEALTRVIVNRTGIAPTDDVLIQEHMDVELKLALRLDGHAGEAHATDSFGGGPAQDSGSEKWSEDAEELMKLVRQLGPRNANLSSAAFLKPFFRHLCLPQLAIRELDDGITGFSRLTSLDVSRNGLTAIDNLPPNIKFLKAYNNRISKVSCKATPSLLFLGLGHNRIGAEGLEQAARRFRNLMSLDLSYSEVADLRTVVSPLAPLQKLRHLCLTGSPICLLPHCRMRLLGGLAQLQVLDGAGVTEEELTDVQTLSEALQLGPRPPTLKLALQPLKLTGVRTLLDVIAKAAPPPPPPPEDAEPPGEDEEPPDPILQVCGGGALKFQLSLPGDRWLETAEVLLDVEKAAEEREAAEAAGEEDLPKAFDTFFLHRLQDAKGEVLYLDMPIEAESGGRKPSNGYPALADRTLAKARDPLVDLCHWLRKGLAIKVSYRPAAPPRPPTTEGEAEAVAPAAEAAEAGEAAEAAEAAEGAEGAEAPEAPPLPEVELPKEVPIGGTVVPLAQFLHREAEYVTDEARQSGELPELPAPRKYEAADMRVVPMDHWLENEVQVPPVKELGQKRSPLGCVTATLAVRVILYAGEPPTEEELDAIDEANKGPPPDPKAKGKAKPKAKK